MKKKNPQIQLIFFFSESFGDSSSRSLPKRQIDENKRVVCYFANWAVYRQGTGKFSPQNINPYLCTHLIYAFGGLGKDDTIQPFDKYQDIEKGILPMIVKRNLIFVLMPICFYYFQ
jgi:hypothetical protein